MKKKVFLKIVSLVIIQTFLLLDIAAAGAGNIFYKDHDPDTNTLSPRLIINAESFRIQFQYYAKLSNSPIILKQTPDAPLEFTTRNLNEGYKKLDSLMSNIDKKEQLILCIDGDVSSGKTTFINLLQENGLGNIDAEGILFISIDDIINDLRQEGDFTLLEAILEMPLILSQKILKANDGAKLIVVEGSESLYYLEKTDFKPDAVAILKASEKTRLVRHLMKHGLFALNFFDEPYMPGEIPDNVPVVFIKNELTAKIDFLPVTGRTLVTTIKIMVTAAVRFIAPHLPDFLGLSSLFKSYKKLGVAGSFLLPLQLLLYVLNKVVDFYFILNPQRNMLSIIKKRFPGRVKILDIGTGDGSFVERFQGLLDKKGIKAEVMGIDIKAKSIAAGLYRKRNVKTLDAADAEEAFGPDSFDLITVNAPDSPEGCVREAMKVLKPDGVLILRLAEWHHTREDRARLIRSIGEDFKVQALSRSLYNMPNGLHYKLQKPVLISRKNKHPGNYELKNRGRNNISADSALKNVFLKTVPIVSISEKKALEFICRAI